MIRLTESRKHYRFPAYEDEAGVKLNRKRNREFLKDILEDDFVYDRERQEKNKRNLFDMDKVEMVDEPVYFGSDRLEESVKSASPKRRRPVAVSSQKSEPLKKYENPELDIKKLDRQTAYVDPKKNYQAKEASYANRFFETNQKGKAKHQLPNTHRRSFESSYRLPGETEKKSFEPKYIPVSMIEETDVRYSDDKKSTLVNELKQASTDHLMSMEPTSAQLHTNDLNNDEQTLSKKNNRLDKSLSGIMKDEGRATFDNVYFD